MSKEIIKAYIYNDLSSIQPMSKPFSKVFYFTVDAMEDGKTYYAKKCGDKWMLCHKEDLLDPNYKPHFAIRSTPCYVIYDDLGHIVYYDHIREEHDFQYIEALDVENLDIENALVLQDNSEVILN